MPSGWAPQLWGVKSHLARKLVAAGAPYPIRQRAETVKLSQGTIPSAYVRSYVCDRIDVPLGHFPFVCTGYREKRMSNMHYKETGGVIGSPSTCRKRSDHGPERPACQSFSQSAIQQALELWQPERPSVVEEPHCSFSKHA